MQLDNARPWASYPLLVLDFETTGVDPLTCSPVSVAAVRYEHGAEVAHLYSLLDPGECIPASASAIHGITDEHVVGAPTLEALAPRFVELAADALPCAYNSTYDRTIFHRYIAGNDCPLFDPAQRWLCALVMIRKIDRYASGQGRHKLINACARFGVELSPDQAHDALCDVRATGRLIAALIEVGKLNPRTSLGKLLDYVDACRATQDADYTAYRARVAAKEAQRELAFDQPTEGGQCRTTSQT